MNQNYWLFITGQILKEVSKEILSFNIPLICKARSESFYIDPVLSSSWNIQTVKEDKIVINSFSLNDTIMSGNYRFHLKSEGTHNIIREMKKDAEMTEHIMEQTNQHFNHNASIESLTFFQKLTQGIGLACIVAIVVAIIIYCCRKF